MCKTQDAQQAAPVPSHLWRIYGRDYDLGDFAKVHPGGTTAVDLGKGDDCTKLFESYHVMSEKHRYVLAKYAKASSEASKTPRVPDGQSAFHTDVKALLRRHFAGQGAHPHKAKFSHALAMGIVIAFYAVAWRGWFQGSYLAVLVLPFLAWLVMANMAHDGSHFATSRHPLVNQLCLYGSSPLYYTDATWYMQHVVSHHLDTNDLKGDVDLHHHGAARWHPNGRKAKSLHGCLNLFWHFTAFIASTFVLAVVQPLTKFVIPGLYVKQGAYWPQLWGSSPVFDRVLTVRLSAGFATASRIAVNFFLWAWAVAVPISSLMAYGFSFKAFLFGFYPFVVSSTLFMTVTQVSHIQRETQTRETLEEPDFFKSQARTSLDYGCGSTTWGFLTGGLNTQSLHHVAPSVHSSHYADLYPKFYELCVKHGCPPPTSPHIGSALRKHLRYIYDLGEGYTLPTPEM